MKLLQVLSIAGGVSVVTAKVVHIVNGCDQPLTVTGTDGKPNLGVLQPGQSLSENARGSAGRYQAYWSAKDIGQAKYGLFEYTVCGNSLCCNPSNVDLLTIPVTLTCSADGLQTGCTNHPTQSDLQAAMKICPTARSEFGSVSDSKFCYSAGYACAIHPDAPNCGRNSNSPMQRAMRKFGGSDSGKNAYGCAGSFATDSPACARLARGVANSFGDPSTYYKAYENKVPLFNEYAKWVHDVCGVNDYAFPYDDNSKHGGFMSCAGDVTVTFCSGGAPTPSPTPTPTPTPSPSPASDCSDYCSTVQPSGSIGCSWTSEWTCPWQSGDKKATDDGSIGYDCCCKRRQTQSDPCGGGAGPTPPSPTPTPSPRPSACPGGSLSACIDLCPPDVFAACVSSCQRRCKSEVSV